MAIDHLLAVVPVTDVETSRRWYASLFGCDADNNPMPSLVEWRVRADGWVQVFADPDRAGSGLLNFAVDDLIRHLDEVRARGIDPGAVQEANKGVRIATVKDPDGNTIRFIGGFRVDY